MSVNNGLKESNCNCQVTPTRYANPENWSGLAAGTLVNNHTSKPDKILCLMGGYNPRNKFSFNSLTINYSLNAAQYIQRCSSLRSGQQSFNLHCEFQLRSGNFERSLLYYTNW